MRNPNRPVARKTPSERRQIARAAAQKTKPRANAPVLAVAPTKPTAAQKPASTDEYGDDRSTLLRGIVVGISSLCVAGALLIGGVMMPKGTFGWQKQPDGSYRRNGMMDYVALLKPGALGGASNTLNTSGNALSAQCRAATGVGLAMGGNKDGLSKAEAEGRRLAAADMCDQIPAAIEAAKDIAAEIKEINRSVN